MLRSLHHVRVGLPIVPPCLWRRFHLTMLLRSRGGVFVDSCGAASGCSHGASWTIPIRRGAASQEDLGARASPATSAQRRVPPCSHSHHRSWHMKRMHRYGCCCCRIAPKSGPVFSSSGRRSAWRFAQFHVNVTNVIHVLSAPQCTSAVLPGVRNASCSTSCQHRCRRRWT